jgi:sensor histidine kinase regulating citrate/malate metabolism
MGIFRSILAKILIPVIGMTIILVAVQLTVSTITFDKFAQESLDHEIRFVAKSIKDLISALRATATDQTRSLADNHEIVTAIKAGNREKIQETFNKFESERKCTFFTILDTESKVIFRTSRPSQFGDTLRMRCVDEA